MGERRKYDGPVSKSVVNMSPRRELSDDFEPARALSRLGDVLWSDKNPSPGLASAWEAAWIACLTDRVSWRDRARVEYQNAMALLADDALAGLGVATP